jgi:hypothetical protein
MATVNRGCVAAEIALGQLWYNVLVVVLELIAALSTRFLRYVREQVFLEMEEEYKGETGEKVGDAAGAMEEEMEQKEGEADRGGKKEKLAVDTEAVNMDQAHVESIGCSVWTGGL